MKDLISQDYIDYQYEEGERKQHPYSGMPVDDLDRACHNHRFVLRVIFKRRYFSSAKINGPFQPDLWFKSWFMIYGSKLRDFVRDHGPFFLDGSKIVRPSIFMNISFI